MPMSPFGQAVDRAARGERSARLRPIYPRALAAIATRLHAIGRLLREVYPRARRRRDPAARNDAEKSPDARVRGHDATAEPSRHLQRNLPEEIALADLDAGVAQD